MTDQPALTEEPDGWRSAHLFFNGQIHSPVCDRILVEVIAPFVARMQTQGAIDRSFFIRYGELGQHLRIRFHGNRRRVAKEVVPQFEQCVARLLTPALRGRPDVPPPILDSPSSLECVQWIPYVPEVARYGGTRGLRIAEEMFASSSVLVCELLQSGAATDPSGRLGMGLAATMVALRAFLGSDVESTKRLLALHRATFAHPSPRGEVDLLRSFESAFARHEHTLGPLIRTLFAMERVDDAPESFQKHYEDCLRARSAIEAEWEAKRLEFDPPSPVCPRETVARLAHSYIHMTNNRLGLTPTEEGYLAHAVLSVLDRNGVGIPEGAASRAQPI